MTIREGSIIPALLESGWDTEPPVLAALRGTAYETALREAFDSLRRDLLFNSALHGKGHIERVLLLGALIAQREALSPADTRILLLACSYHDVGRIGEGVEDLHGARSAECLRSGAFDRELSALSGTELTILLAAIAAHSVSGLRRLEYALRYGVPDAERPRYEKLAKCLKDADNLDRVRLGDLDPSRLRHAGSRALAPFAEALFEQYMSC